MRDAELANSQRREVNQRPPGAGEQAVGSCHFLGTDFLLGGIKWFW